MTAVSNDTVLQMFKNVYGDINDLLPEDYPLAKEIPFSEKQKVGEKYLEGVVLTSENGWTLGGSGMDAFEINPAVAGAVRQAEVTPYMSVLASVVPWGVLSRSAGGGARSFLDGTKHIVKNNLKSHGKLLEILRLYGQSSALLGYVSYTSATYRAVSFTTGTGALTINGTSVSFTNGVNTTSKHILLAPGEFAAGIWVGSEGAIVQQVDTNGVVVAEGSLVEVDADMGALKVDFTPVAASSATSHRLCFKGMADAKDMVGIHKIMTTSGSVFGISNNTFSIWKGTTVANAALKFKFSDLNLGIGRAVNRCALGGEGEGSGDLDVWVNPRTFTTLVSTENAARSYDSSYTPQKAENGVESLVFHHQAGKSTIKTHRMIKEGHAIGLHKADWSRSGSAEISFKVPGINKEVIFPLENQAAWAFRSFADQYIFCNAPGRSIFWTGINDESST